jgi:WASH complex subunit 7
MSVMNPVKDKRDKIRPYIVMGPITVFDEVLDVHDKVKRFLEATFYNLTTLALHDWLTYSEMANLAREKYVVLSPPPTPPPVN